MLKTLTQQAQTILYDESQLQDDPQHVFNIDYWREKSAIIGSATGRGTTWFLQASNQQLALRHYYRGGLFGKLIKQYYLFTGLENTRPFKEFRLLKHLTEAGVNVPTPVAAKVTRFLGCYQGDLLTARVPNAADMIDILNTDRVTQTHWEMIGREIQKMHRAQVCHTDLNIKNILLDDKENVWIIDFDKCQTRKGEAWKAANLARLKRSLDKQQRKGAISYQASDWQALLAGYDQSQ
ncbi:3-deoxy-D-manno-octulosonic acid kinase [Thaumasiovibrio subtropicus]|uniref:3-deoxy-D-manno-octulosonic acid kinase n=1 Tax=Thaumasiovibrio subtropicus TaxID=1891207 RepID=UPI001863CA30|nr:3-deoxy-D-manno-octulosonic acid kinase [Thaumasiovibrio subtropicus]